MPALLRQHPQHDAATAELDLRLARGDALVLAAPALVETYSVLTRNPPSLRVSPSEAWRLLESNLLGNAGEIVALDSATYIQLLSAAPRQGTAGGRVYDAVIVACARTGQVDTILTFNERQFRALAAGAIEIVVPSV